MGQNSPFSRMVEQELGESPVAKGPFSALVEAELAAEPAGPQPPPAPSQPAPVLGDRLYGRSIPDFRGADKFLTEPTWGVERFAPDDPRLEGLSVQPLVSALGGLTPAGRAVGGAFSQMVEPAAPADMVANAAIDVADFPKMLASQLYRAGKGAAQYGAGTAAEMVGENLPAILEGATVPGTPEGVLAGAASRVLQKRFPQGLAPVGQEWVRQAFENFSDLGEELEVMAEQAAKSTSGLILDPTLHIAEQFERALAQTTGAKPDLIQPVRVYLAQHGADVQTLKRDIQQSPLMVPMMAFPLLRALKANLVPKGMTPRPTYPLPPGYDAPPSSALPPMLDPARLGIVDRAVGKLTGQPPYRTESSAPPRSWSLRPSVALRDVAEGEPRVKLTEAERMVEEGKVPDWEAAKRKIIEEEMAETRRVEAENEARAKAELESANQRLQQMEEEKEPVSRFILERQPDGRLVRLEEKSASEILEEERQKQEAEQPKKPEPPPESKMDLLRKVSAQIESIDRALETIQVKEAMLPPPIMNVRLQKLNLKRDKLVAERDRLLEELKPTRGETKPTPTETEAPKDYMIGQRVKKGREAYWIVDTAVAEDGTIRYTLAKTQTGRGRKSRWTAKAEELKPFEQKAREGRAPLAPPSNPWNFRETARWMADEGGWWEPGETLEHLRGGWSGKSGRGWSVPGLVRKGGRTRDAWRERIKEEWPERFKDDAEAEAFLDDFLRRAPDKERTGAAAREDFTETDAQRMADEWLAGLEEKVSRSPAPESAQRFGIGREGSAFDEILAALKDKPRETIVPKEGDLLLIPDPSEMGGRGKGPDVFRVKENRAKGTVELVDGERITLSDMQAAEGLTAIKMGELPKRAAGEPLLEPTAKWRAGLEPGPRVRERAKRAEGTESSGRLRPTKDALDQFDETVLDVDYDSAIEEIARHTAEAEKLRRYIAEGAIKPDALERASSIMDRERELAEGGISELVSRYEISEEKVRAAVDSESKRIVEEEGGLEPRGGKAKSRALPGMEEERAKLERAEAEARASREAEEAADKARQESASRGESDLFDNTQRSLVAEEHRRKLAEQSARESQTSLLEDAPEQADKRYVLLDSNLKPTTDPLTQAEAARRMAQGSGFAGILDLETKQAVDRRGRVIDKNHPLLKPPTGGGGGGLLGAPSGADRAANLAQAIGMATKRKKPPKAPAGGPLIQRPRPRGTLPRMVTRGRPRPLLTRRDVKHQTVRQKIVADLEELFYTSYSVGRLFLRKARGEFRPVERTIAMEPKYGADLPTIYHEAGHAAARVLFPEIGTTSFDPAKIEGVARQDGRTAQSELVGLGRALYKAGEPPQGYAAEGLAEFMRLWLTDRDTALNTAPTFSKIFSERLAGDAVTIRLAKALDEVYVITKRFQDLPATQKILERISFRITGDRRLTLGKLYETFFDDQHAIMASVKAMTGHEEWTPHLGDPGLETWLYRGNVGRAIAMLHHGFPDLSRAELLGWLRRANLDTPGVRAKTDPIANVPTRKSSIEERVTYKHLYDRFIQGDEVSEPGLLEVRDGKVYLTDKGVEDLGKHTFEKIGESLEEIIRKVADEEFPFFKSLVADDGAIRKLTERFGGRHFKPGGIFHPGRNQGLVAFRAYLIAREAKYLLEERGISAGFDKATLESALAELERPAFVEAFDKLQGYQRNLLNMLYREGMLSKREMRLITGKNRVYVPLQRIVEGRRYSVQLQRAIGPVQKPLRRRSAKGVDLDFVDPLETTVQNTFLINNVVARNGLLRTLHRFAQDNPGSGWVIQEVAKRRVPTYFKLEEIKKQIKEALSESGILDELTEELQKSALKMIDLDRWAAVWRNEARAPGGEYLIPYWKGGEQIFLKVEPDLYRTLMGMDELQTNIWLKLMGAPTRVLRAGATLDPVFWIRNITRDQFTAAINSIETAMIPGLSTLATAVKRLREPVKADDLYLKWLASGGAISALASLDRNYLGKAVRDLARDPRFQRRIFDGAMHPIETLRVLSEAMEGVTRRTIFRKNIERYGMDQDSLLLAAWRSRDTTIDFNRMGTASRALNQAIAFFNPSVQDINKISRLIADSIRDANRQARAAGYGGASPMKKIQAAFGALQHAKKGKKLAARITTYIIAPSILNWYWNKDNPDYQQLPHYIKDFFWLIPTGQEWAPWIPIPKPYSWGVLFGSFTERALDWMYRDDPEAFDGFGRNLAASVLPTAVPTLISYAIENGMNMRLHTGAPVAPEETLLDPEEIYGPGTSATAKLLSGGIRAASEATGIGFGRAVSPFTPSDQLNPRQFDNMVNNVTAGLGMRYGLPLADVAVHLLTPESLKRHLNIGKGETRTSILARVRSAGAVQPESIGRVLVDSYYERLEDSRRAMNTFTRKEDEGAIDWIQNDDNRIRLSRYHALNEAEGDIQGLQRERKQHEAAGDRKAALETWKKIRDRAAHALEIAALAEAEAKAGFSDAWTMRQVRLRNQKINLERAELRDTIEDFWQNKRFREFQSWARTLDLIHRKWAFDYMRDLRQDERKTPAEKILEGVPRSFGQREEVRREAEQLERQGAQPR